jgi:hypothetical protein
MLPEFAKARQKMLELWGKTLFSGLHGSDPLLSEFPVRVQKEGTAAVIGGGEIEYKTCSVEMSFPARVAEGLSREEFLGGAFRMGAEMAGKQAQGILETLVKPESGFVSISWSGELTLETVLDAWSKLPFEFDENDRPQWPLGVFSPAAKAEVDQKLQLWLQDSETHRKLSELVDAKKKEFDEREARRRLVD